MIDKKTTDFKIWKQGRWIQGNGIISESLLCARPTCRKRPFNAARYKKKKYCSRACCNLHTHQKQKSSK